MTHRPPLQRDVGTAVVSTPSTVAVGRRRSVPPPVATSSGESREPSGARASGRSRPRSTGRPLFSCGRRRCTGGRGTGVVDRSVAGVCPRDARDRRRFSFSADAQARGRCVLGVAHLVANAARGRAPRSRERPPAGDRAADRELRRRRLADHQAPMPEAAPAAAAPLVRMMPGRRTGDGARPCDRGGAQGAPPPPGRSARADGSGLAGELHRLAGVDAYRPRLGTRGRPPGAPQDLLQAVPEAEHRGGSPGHQVARRSTQDTYSHVLPAADVTVAHTLARVILAGD
jgi:hypothetical protein